MRPSLHSESMTRKDGNIPEHGIIPAAASVVLKFSVMLAGRPPSRLPYLTLSANEAVLLPCSPVSSAMGVPTTRKQQAAAFDCLSWNEVGEVISSNIWPEGFISVCCILAELLIPHAAFESISGCEAAISNASSWRSG